MVNSVIFLEKTKIVVLSIFCTLNTLINYVLLIQFSNPGGLYQLSFIMDVK